MIGIDTNILVRYLTQDDPQHSKVVNAFIEKILKTEEKLCANLTVICELVWVLEDCYQYSKKEVHDALKAISEVHIIEIESREVLFQALEDFQKHSADISDCIIGRYNSTIHKCPYTISFDKNACKLNTFRSLN